MYTGNVLLFGRIVRFICNFLSSPHSVELEEVSNLFESGCDLLIKEFRIILQKNSHPVPDSILADLATCEDISPPEHFSVRVMSQLQSITRYLVSKGLSDFMNVYFQVCVVAN